MAATSLTVASFVETNIALAFCLLFTGKILSAFNYDFSFAYVHVMYVDYEYN